MSRPIKICAAMLFAFGIASSAVARRAPPAEPVVSVPHEVVVSIEKRTLAVHFAPGAEAPDPAEIAALNVLLATGDLGRGDVVRIERPPGPLAQGRAVMLSEGLTREGLSASIMVSGAVREGELRLQIEHAVASAPGCPDWSKPPGNDFDNTLHSDFGCATAINLAAMIADPRDLISGRAMGPKVGDPAVAAMHRYRTGKLSEGDGSPTITITSTGGTSQ